MNRSRMRSYEGEGRKGRREKEMDVVCALMFTVGGKFNSRCLICAE